MPEFCFPNNFHNDSFWVPNPTLKYIHVTYLFLRDSDYYYSIACIKGKQLKFLKWWKFNLDNIRGRKGEKVFIRIPKEAHQLKGKWHLTFWKKSCSVLDGNSTSVLHVLQFSPCNSYINFKEQKGKKFPLSKSKINACVFWNSFQSMEWILPIGTSAFASGISLEFIFKSGEITMLCFLKVRGELAPFSGELSGECFW